MTAETSPRLVVGVGASAGGLEAFRALLGALPDRSGMAFLLVQHLDPTHESKLIELLQRFTEMEVVGAEQGEQVRCDVVYVIPPNTALALRDDRIELTAPVLHRGVRLPVDHLFSSLAREYGPRAAVIVLSGAGSDGSVGLREVKAAGGLTIAQHPSGASQSAMPQSAIDSGRVDLVLPIADMPEALQRFRELPRVVRNDPVRGTEDRRVPMLDLEGDMLDRLASELEKDGQFDLRVYKSGTIERRVLRRMGLLGIETPEQYLEQLSEQAVERKALIRDLLIGVTDFFRDPEAFKALRHKVIEPLVASASPEQTLRVWVPGCATGEEAYSIAIAFLEALASRPDVGVHIFATDIDEDALSAGRSGVYLPAVASQMSEKRLEEHFEPFDGRNYRIRPHLRDLVSFAVHDLTKDPPFSRMDLVSCRNVLIYLRPEAQERVLNALHFALAADRYLFLGTSESTGPQRELYATVSKQWRIYRKVGESPPMTLGRVGGRGRRGSTAFGVGRPTPVRPGELSNDEAGVTRAAVMQARVPPTIVVSDEGSVLFTHGELRPYLRFPEGAHPRFDFASVVAPELAHRTRAALYRCRKDKETVVVISSPDPVRSIRTKIMATPAFELGDGVVILSFEDLTDESPPPHVAESPAQDQIIEQLEAELHATREDLRNTVEELENSNEELRSSNEESVSMNEELQSSNEELEATTEELRSLNEELTSVNSQLRDKVEQVQQARNDLYNFISSTKIATLFLDETLRIKRFTPAAAELLGLDDGDLGKEIDPGIGELCSHDLRDETVSVLDHLSPVSREIKTEEDGWVVRQVLPYRTEMRRIEGVVVTFVDVTDLKSTTERLAIRERQQAVIARLGLQALKGADLQTFMDQTVREVQQTLGSDFCKMLELQPDGEVLLLREGVGWREGLVGSATVTVDGDSQAGYSLQTGETVIVDDVREERRFSGSDLFAEHGVLSGVSCPIGDGDTTYGVIGVHSRHREAFTREDAHFLQAVAGIIGSAVSRHQARIRLAVESGTAQALAASLSLDAAMEQVLSSFTREVGASIGELWWPREDGKLRCRMRSVESPHATDEVDRNFTVEVFAQGQGLIGHAFEHGNAMWMTAFDNRSQFLRAEGAKRLGLSTGLVFPIRSGRHVLGVITAFSQRRLIADRAFLRSLESLGQSIGSFVQRIEAENKAQWLAAIAASSHDAIISYDFEGTITEWLGGADQLYGYSADEMIGHSIERLIPESYRKEFWELVGRAREDEFVDALETVRAHKDGTMISVSVRASPIKDEAGNVTGVSSTDRDITRQKQTEDRLMEADRQKDEFLAMLGHELRNPLAAVRSAAELIKVDASEPILRHTQEILERQSSHMAKLLDGLLDVSRIIRGKIHIETEPLDLAAVCREVTDDIRSRIGNRSLDLSVDLPTASVWVDGDRVRLTQVIDNLLSNAVKYTRDGGSIAVVLTCRDGEALLRVRDTGVGIETELLPNIFDVFQQAKQNLDRSHGGLGLGLALVKSLVELHGGSVEARSAGPDRGSEFEVRLPLVTPVISRTGGEAVKAKRARILLIEDDADVAAMLEQILAAEGHEIILARRGQQGVELAKAEHPDVVLCDLGLPGGMTGYDVARTMRDDPELNDLRLVAVTGYGRPEDKQRCLEAGFDSHLTKPIDARSIDRVLVELRHHET